MTKVTPIAFPTFTIDWRLKIGDMGKIKSRTQLIEECDINLRQKREKRKQMVRERYVAKFRKKYGDKYEYPDDDFYSPDRKITVICPEHGAFRVSIQGHIRGSECPHCNPPLRSQKGNPSLKHEKKESSIQHSLAYKRKREHRDEESVRKSKNNYNKLYARHKADIEKKSAPAKIRKERKKRPCPSVFNNEIPSKGESAVEFFLKKNNIKYFKQHHFQNEYLFNLRSYIIVDFYLPYENLVIEYNGQQHYFPVEWFGGQEVFEQQQERDHALRLYCKEHEINLLEISYLEEKNIEKIIEWKLMDIIE